MISTINLGRKASNRSGMILIQFNTLKDNHFFEIENDSLIDNGLMTFYHIPGIRILRDFGYSVKLFLYHR